MNHTVKILKYTARDLLRSRIVPLYTAFFVLLWMGLYYLSGDAIKTASSLIQIITAVVPLVSLVFGTMIYYNSGDFILFMLTQPVKRSSIFIAMNTAVALVMSVSIFAGITIPAVVTGSISAIPITALLAGVSVAITCIFSAIAFLTGAATKDKVHALSAAIFIWLFFAVIFDGLIVLISVYFYDYPLELPVLILSAMNPVDLGRIVLLMYIDHSALMGYTGALYKSFFTGYGGAAAAIGMMSLWYILPFIAGLRSFSRRDF